MIWVQRNIFASMKSWFIRHIHLAGRSAAIISTSVSVVHTWHIACSMSSGSSGSSPHGMSRVAAPLAGDGLLVQLDDVVGPHVGLAC